MPYRYISIPQQKLYIPYSLIAFKCFLKDPHKPPKKPQQTTSDCLAGTDSQGRHLLTAVLFPRMRVDNGLTLWNALAGTKAGLVKIVAFLGQTGTHAKVVHETCRKTLKFDVL